VGGAGNSRANVQTAWGLGAATAAFAALIGLAARAEFAASAADFAEADRKAVSSAIRRRHSMGALTPGGLRIKRISAEESQSFC